MTKTQKNASKLTFPCSAWTLINAMIAMAWGYYRNKNKKGVEVRSPRKFTCPSCQAKRLAEKKSPTLAKRASQNVVVFWKQDGSRIAVCHVCGYTKREGSITAPPTAAKVENACLGCGKILSSMEARYCDNCQKRVDKNAPRDSYGRFICKCGAVLPEDRKAKCYACHPPKKVAAPANPPVEQPAVQVTSM